MPKKFSGENSKSVQAKARKAAVKEEQSIQKQKKLEDEYWRDNDKHVVRKALRKEEQDRKKLEHAEKKAASKALLEKEMSSMKSTKVQPAKVTRTQISANIAENATALNVPEMKVDLITELPLEENLNRLMLDQEVARTVTDAISILSSQDTKVDKHPEKRLKAAYTVFEERRLRILKEENPTLRLSQLKQVVFKEWQKSSENPLNNLQS